MKTLHVKKVWGKKSKNMEEYISWNQRENNVANKRNYLFLYILVFLYGTLLFFLFKTRCKHILCVGMD